MNETHQGNSFAPTNFLPEDGLDFKKMLAHLYRHMWIILGVAVCTFFIAILYTFTLQPQYQTTSLIQIHAQSTNSNMLGKLGYKAGGDSASDTQIALIRSRYILEPVTIQNNLNVSITPHYLPLIGKWKARLYHGNGVAKPFLWLKSYAWGGEKIEIKQFTVPRNYIGQPLRLVASENNSYQLYSADNHLLLSGKVGEQLSNAGIQLELASLNAHPGVEFILNYQSPALAQAGLARKLQITNVLGNDIAQSTGIYQLKLTGNNPDETVKILNSIVNTAVANNAQQKMLDTQKTLEFLNQRMPEVKANLENTEDALNQYHVKNTTLSMMVASQMIVKQLTSVEQALSSLKSQRAELLQTYTPLHPLVIALTQKQAELEKKLEEIKIQIRKFPIANQEEINLLREVKIKTSMYVSILNNKHQMELVKAGLLGDVVALTDATPAIGVPLHKAFTILMGFLIGAFLASIAVIIKSAFTKTVESSDQLEDELRVPVQAVLPHSRKQKLLEKSHQKGLETFGSALSAPLILAKQEPDDITIESLRSLRVSLHMMTSSSSQKVLAMMGSLTNVGKSFVSLNLSQVIADTGKRTILIDADIRKGHLHRSLHQPKTNGLSEFLEGKCSLEDILRHIHDSLFFISCGTHTAHPIQLFQNQRFKDLIAKLKQEFDQVIIDTPPVIPVADSLLIAQYCDIKLFVVSAGKDTIDDVKQAFKKARTNGIEINSIVLNHRKSLVPYGSRYYQRYAYGNTETTTA